MMKKTEDLRDFAEKILRMVGKKADGAFSVRLVNNLKNNGVRKIALTISASGPESVPCVYLEDYFEEYRNGEMGLEEAAEYIYQIIVGARISRPDLDVANLFQWENVRSHIRAALVNTELNREKLSEQPHRALLDLSIVYYIKVKNTDMGDGIIFIRNLHLSRWKKDEETLYRTALENMTVLKETRIFDMKELISFCSVSSPDGMGQVPGDFYVLTNKEKYQGAAAVLDEATLLRLQDRMGPFVILPSSVHEVIIISDNWDGRYEKLAEMVKVVNETELMPEDYLSGHVYVYDKDKGGLKIAA